MPVPPKLIRQIVICVVASIAFYGVSVVVSGWEDVSSAVARMGWSGWGIILGLSLVNYLLRFVRWQVYLNHLGCRVPVFYSLSVYLAGFAFTATPGKVGEAVRSVYLKPYSVTYVNSLSAFFVERFVDVIAMVLLASLAAFAFEDMRWLVIVTALVVLLVLPLIHSSRVQARIERFRQGLASEKLRALGEHVLNLLESSASLLRAGPLYGGLFLGAIAWLAEGYALYVVLDFLGVEMAITLAAGIYGVSILAGAVSFMPGGLGGTEVVMGVLLGLSGVEPAIAVSAVLVCRIATLWFAVLVGLMVLSGLELGGARPAGQHLEDLANGEPGE
ncbi:MAG: lysylphosphatidylglycerol synthase transmembrane domain-containing protein [Gammaproteobacteria bacterium]